MKTNAYITDEQVMKRARAAVRLELEKLKEMDIEPVLYDRETRAIYKLHSDGTRTILHVRESETIFND